MVEWVKPQILRMFTDTDEVVRFEPEGPQDEQEAEQASDAVNYLIMRKNDGVLILHDMLTDALLLKNGYVKVWYEEDTRVRYNSYTGLDLQTLVMVIQEIEQSGFEAEIVAKEEKHGYQVDPQSGQQVPTVTYDVRIKLTQKEGAVHIECVATEDMLVSPNTRGDLQESPFVA